MIKGPAKKKPGKTRQRIHVEVLQNGAEVARIVRPLKRNTVLALTSDDGKPLSLPHYPLPDGRLEFLRIEGGVTRLVVDHMWEGFCTTKGVLTNISKGEKGKHVVELFDGDYGSISHDDLRILVKVGPQGAAVAPDLPRLDPAFRAGFVRNFVRSPSEALGLGVAAVVAFVVLAGFATGLAMRPYSKPARLNDIAEGYMLPFIAPSHLLNAPEALQGNLDRQHVARSVIEFYQSTTAVLMSWNTFDPRFLQPTTVELYNNLFAQAHETIVAHVQRQEAIDREQAAKKDVGIPAIPAVVGETMAGSMLRVIDKIDIMEEGFARDLAAKRAVVADFPKDPEYDYQEYKSVTPKDSKTQDYLSKIKPFQLSTDEQLMYGDAERLSSLAKAKQERAAGDLSMVRHLDERIHQPIAMTAGVRFGSFLSDVNFRLLDERLYKIEASEFGPRKSIKAVAKEPLVGEIDANLVEKFIKQNRFQLQLCYELALRRNEGAGGTMEWRWRIDSRGGISDVALVSTTIRDQKMQQCIRQKISNWRFPRPRRGSVEVSYPFEFAPTKG